MKNAKVVAGIIRTTLNRLEKKTAPNAKYRVAFSKISTTRIDEYSSRFNRHMLVLGAFATHLTNVGARILTPTQIGSLASILSHEDSEAIIPFFREVITGVRLRPETNIAQVLRTKLINDKIRKTSFTKTYKVDLIIKAFRLYSKGESRKSISVQPDEKIMLPDMDYEFTAPKLDFEAFERYHIA